LAGARRDFPDVVVSDLRRPLMDDSVLRRRLEDKIAELDQANRKLKESEARFRSLTEMSSDFYWESDAEHRLTQRGSADRKVSTVSVFARGAQIGERRWDIPYVTPDAAGWAAHRAVLDAHRPFREFMFSRMGIDGSERFISISGDPVFDATGVFTGYRGVGSDITERRRVETALAESEKRFRSLTALSSDFYWETDEGHRLMARSETNSDESKAVFKSEPRLGKCRWEIPSLSPDVAGWAAHRAMLDAHQPFRDFEFSRVGTDGGERFVCISGDPLFDTKGAFTGYRGVGSDVTARRRAEHALRASEDRYRDLIENSQDLICTHDLNGQLLSVNAALVRASGYSQEALLGMNMADLLTQGARPGFTGYLVEIATSGRARGVIHVRTAGGEARWWEYDNSLRTEGVAAPVVRGVAHDVTELRRAESARKSSEDRFRKAFQLNPDAININRLEDGMYVSINGGFTQITGYTEDEVLGRTSLELNIWDDPKDRTRLVQGLKKDGFVANLDARFRAKDGSVRDGLMSAAPIDIDGVPHIINITRDITERVRIEDELAQSEMRFRGLVEQSITGNYIIQDGRIVYVNPRMAQIAGYASAEELIGRDPLSLVAEMDRDMVAQNMRERMEGNVTAKDYEFTGLRKDGTLTVIGVHAARAMHNGRPAIIGLMQDISEKKRAEEQIQTYVAQLETAFMSTVEVATTMGEMRDPYTAGHQRRVAEIAVAIGAELGFDARRQEGLRVAGYLHDIGKITIPAEILSKPGKLSPTEYKLVQGHAQASYDVLKDVQFPWPVADVALQHHERMDGSGYPQGLKGAAIRIESRIVAVADVLEAMSTHRPYRPGLGLDKALAEIERGRGSAYDVDVADACCRLLREQRYTLPL